MQVLRRVFHKEDNLTAFIGEIPLDEMSVETSSIRILLSDGRYLDIRETGHHEIEISNGDKVRNLSITPILPNIIKVAAG